MSDSKTMYQSTITDRMTGDVHKTRKYATCGTAQAAAERWAKLHIIGDRANISTDPV